MRSPVVAVIQARMGSSRLPGKVLMPVAGAPLLWHIIHRLGQCHTVDQVAVATSTDASDDPIETFCAGHGITCVRGPLQNVLERYRLAAEATGAGTLLRITGDAPLIDPGLIDYLVESLGSSDFVQLQEGALCAHEGADVFSRHALDWLVTHAGQDEIAREHVTSYFKRRTGAVKTVHVPAYPPLARPLPYHISIDQQADLDMLCSVYARLGAKAGEACLPDVLNLLDSDPELRAINAHVRQKPLTEVERVAGAGRLGIGTVQFGQAYGISNLRGQVPLVEARAILARAARAGIGLLDTAANYGEAEQVLAQLDTSSFRIVTKTISVGHGVEALTDRARQSVATLGRVDLLLVHMVSDLLGPDGEALWTALRGLKDDGVVGGIGISAYVADDPAALAARFKPDAMQVPFSLLDQRLLQDGSLARLKDLDVEVHARSVFLQGLLFLESLPDNLRAAGPLLASVRQRIAASGATPLAAALGFVLSRPEVDVAVTGVTSVKELEEILAAATAPLPQLDWSGFALDDARLLTPSLW